MILILPIITDRYFLFSLDPTPVFAGPFFLRLCSSCVRQDWGVDINKRVRKLLAVVLTVLMAVGFVPGAGSVYNVIVMAGESQEALPLLPVGEELGDEKLAEVEGELIPLKVWLACLIIGAIGGAGAGIHAGDRVPPTYGRG